MAKKIIITMVVFAAILIFGGGLISMVISAMVGGGTAESYIYPLYGGIVLLSGLVVGCTCLILKELERIEKK